MIYIASPFGAKYYAKWLERRLQERGYNVASQWYNTLALADPPEVTAGFRAEWQENLALLAASTVLIVLACASQPMRGTCIEIGYATGKGLPVIAVGANVPVSVLAVSTLHIPSVSVLLNQLECLAPWTTPTS